MAGRLSRLHLIIGATVLMAALIPSVSAQALPDPTRPAVDDRASTDDSGNVTNSAVGLQVIIRRKGAKPAAIINGDYVELGGRVGESRLSAVEEDFVVLTGPSGKETLTLTPGIKKQPMEQKSEDRTGKSIKKSHKPARKQ